jgi:chromate transport protein ChrA
LSNQIFVDKQQWVDETTFVDLFALGNALPGPALSQLAFSVALLRGGMIPALLSFFLLSGPGAGAMLGIGFAIRSLPSDLPPIVYASFSGLNSAAVGLVRARSLRPT